MKKPKAQFLKSSFLLDFFPISIYWVESFTTPVLTSLAGHGEKMRMCWMKKKKFFKINIRNVRKVRYVRNPSQHLFSCGHHAL